MRPGVVALACFVLGVVLMVPFEAVLTRVLGVLLLFTAIVVGVFAIATPELLEDGEDEGSG